jgi:hypothetical protein
MIRVSSSGSFRKTMTFLDRLRNGDIYRELDQYGRLGVQALSAATPQDTGKTAASWTYSVRRSRGGVTIAWDNTNGQGQTKVAVLIQYGHGTGTGGYVSGRDYINPTMRPVFDQIAQDVWRKVTNG